jgi:DNA-binding MarR family transcriptional regulator
MKPNKDRQDSEILVQHILKLAEDIYRAIKPGIPPEWLTSDLTVAQLRVLLILHTEGASRMSTIASSIGIALSTATGIVDNLVKKGLINRGDDPEDRRLVICTLSSEGQETINRLWTLGQFQIEKLLDGLSLEELSKADEVAEILLGNVMSSTNSA